MAGSTYEPARVSMIEECKAPLQKAGVEIAGNLKLSKETEEALNRQWIPTDIYNEQVYQLGERLVPGEGQKAG